MNIVSALARVFTAAALIGATACSTLLREPIVVGDTEAEVLAKWGQPAGRYRAEGIDNLAYPEGSFGQRTYMVRIGPDGHVISAEQVLTDEKFSTVTIGKTTQDEILRTFGPPYETSYLPLKDYEVWTYAYKESGVWDSLMHVHFDRSGIVRMMLRTPDPRYEEGRLPFR